MRAKTDGTPQVTLDFIRNILVREMELDPERVNIFNQRFKIPTDDGLFIVIDYKGSQKVISSRDITVPTADSFKEVQEISMQELVSVNIFSRGLDAIRRKEEVLMAMNSLYAQAVQESYNFKISRASAINNLSDLEGSAMLNRFEISLVCFAWYSKEKNGDYYDTFEAELSTETETAIPILSVE